MTFAARKLKSYELTYLAHNLELVVMMVVLIKRRHYLNRVIFEVFTDRKILRYLYHSEKNESALKKVCSDFTRL